jgi:hypothetical protein
MSNTVLMLLGITVAGGTFARASSDWSGISARSRRFLLGQEILRVRRDKPRFSDILETQGEVDVAKVQSLLFTTACRPQHLGEWSRGTRSVRAPEQIDYLLGISQATYVFGKLIPADTRKRVEQELEQLRTAAANLVAAPGDAQLKSAFEQAKRAVASTLTETYLDRFNEGKFKTITEHDV